MYVFRAKINLISYSFAENFATNTTDYYLALVPKIFYFIFFSDSGPKHKSAGTWQIDQATA